MSEQEKKASPTKDKEEEMTTSDVSTYKDIVFL